MSRRMNLNDNKLSKLSKIVEMDNESLVVPLHESSSSPLTPITSITRDLGRSSLSSDDTPVRTRPTMSKLEELRLCNDENSRNELFRNAFKIRGTPEGTVKKPSTRRRRLIGMASGRITSSPELGSSPCANSQNLECTAIFSPNGQNSTPHKPSVLKSFKPRFPLDEVDPNSQDSGYGGGANFSDEKNKQRPSFRFTAPLGVAPRRLSLESRSPMKSPALCSPLRKRQALFRSLSSGYESTDDGFNDLIDMESLDNEMTLLPNDLSNLISGDIVNGEESAEKPMDLDVVSTTPEAAPTTRAKLNIRRSIAQQVERAADDEDKYSPPSVSKVRSCLFRSPNASCSAAKLGFNEQSPRLARAKDAVLDSPPVRKFKRPEPPVDHSPVLVKRSRKCTSYQEVNPVRKTLQVEPKPLPAIASPLAIASPPALTKSQSEPDAHAQIKSAIHRSTTDADLTGDFSKPCVLPLAEGQHEDLKSISSETLSRLIKGDYNDCVSDYKIVDCRYPYEYEAGHIKGALNLYSKDLIEQFLLDPLKHTPVSIEPETQKRSILVFHCEFSFERGPNLSRFLRNIDRQRNKEYYPALHYPEIYLLHGGYQRFYKDQSELCSGGYRPMRHPDHEADLRQFRSKSKSWQGEKNSRTNVVTARANLKRLGF